MTCRYENENDLSVFVGGCDKYILREHLEKDKKLVCL